MKNIAISVLALYAKFGNELTYNIIEVQEDNGCFWYDIYDDNELVCMDGEEVSINEISNDGVWFRNDNGDTATYFKLSNDECKVAMFEDDYKAIMNMIKL